MLAGGAGKMRSTEGLCAVGCSMKPVGRNVYGKKVLIRPVVLKYVLFSVLSPYIF